MKIRSLIRSDPINCPDPINCSDPVPDPDLAIKVINKTKIYGNKLNTGAGRCF